MESLFSREQIERAARIYATNADAARALDIASSSFGRLCRTHSVQSPRERALAEKEARQ
jgi:hypothetical protein